MKQTLEEIVFKYQKNGNNSISLLSVEERSACVCFDGKCAQSS